MPGGLCPSASYKKGVVMPNSQQRLWFALCVASGLFAASAAPSRLLAQGGEPKYFAIRGATVVPVSGPRLENTTIVIARGVISAIGKDAAIPDEASVIDGKGLTVYPGLVDSFTDVGIPPVPTAASEGGQHAQQSVSRGPEDRPGASPWRTAAEEVNLRDKRIETWRAAGFTTVISAPKGGMFPGQAAVLDLAGERNGDLVVKSPVALPISFQPVGNFSSFPGSLMGSLAYVHQVLLDTDWSTKAEAAYDKNPRGVARPRYDRVNSALAKALEDHAVVLIPANDSIQIRRALDLVARWHVNGVFYGGQMSYEGADEIA